MNRRQFLLSAGAVTASALGCSRQPPTPGASKVSATDGRIIAAQQKAREAHMQMLSGYRVPVDAKRTTPPRGEDLVKLFPDLDLRTRLRASLRLHPRFSEEPQPHGTKLGGRFFWPKSEPWPTCERYGIPLVPVLQARAEDCPPSVHFKPGTDLLQVLWSPRDHGDGGPKAHLFWHKASNLEPAEAPSTEFAFLDFVPVPCRAFLEQITELPDWATIRVTPLGDKIKSWKPAVAPGSVLADPVQHYQKHLSAAPGTKIGGFPFWKGEAKPPVCPSCNRGMDYLLTIDSDEWGGGMSWAPLEEHQFIDHAKPSIPGFAQAHGLTLPAPGNLHAFLCRKCESWPSGWAK